MAEVALLEYPATASSLESIRKWALPFGISGISLPHLKEWGDDRGVLKF